MNYKKNKEFPISFENKISDKNKDRFSIQKQVCSEMDRRKRKDGPHVHDALWESLQRLLLRSQ